MPANKTANRKLFAARTGMFWVLVQLFRSGCMAFAAAEDVCKDGPVVVVGATGATGKHVVHQLLQVGKPVHAIVRSKERLLELLPDNSETSLLTVTEASILEMSQKEVDNIVAPASSVVSCLGHNLDFDGMFGRKNRLLVKKAAEKLTNSMTTQQKFILMNSDGVAVNGDDQRVFLERVILFLLRNLIPPHAGNEAAAAYVQSLGLSKVQWAVVRPTDLVDGNAPKTYVTFEKPPGSLFGSGVVTRATVAKFMVDLLTNDTTWAQHKFKFPVVYDQESQPKAAGR